MHVRSVTQLEILTLIVLVFALIIIMSDVRWLLPVGPVVLWSLFTVNSVVADEEYSMFATAVRAMRHSFFPQDEHMQRPIHTHRSTQASHASPSFAPLPSPTQPLLPIIHEQKVNHSQLTISAPPHESPERTKSITNSSSSPSLSSSVSSPSSHSNSRSSTPRAIPPASPSVRLPPLHPTKAHTDVSENKFSEEEKVQLVIPTLPIPSPAHQNAQKTVTNSSQAPSTTESTADSAAVGETSTTDDSSNDASSPETPTSNESDSAPISPVEGADSSGALLRLASNIQSAANVNGEAAQSRESAFMSFTVQCRRSTGASTSTLTVRFTYRHEWQQVVAAFWSITQPDAPLKSLPGISCASTQPTDSCPSSTHSTRRLKPHNRRTMAS